MAEKITYQVKIDLGNVALNNPTFGIASGILYATTGDSVTIESNQYVGDLLEDNSMPTFQQYVDIKDSGGYVNFSQVSIRLNNTTGLLSYFRANNVIIRGLLVTVFIKIDSATQDVLWIGKINEHPANRKYVTLVCVDEYNTIHSDQPSTPISSTTIASTSDDLIPLIIGNSKKSKLVKKLSSQGISFDLQNNVVSDKKDNVYILGYKGDIGQNYYAPEDLENGPRVFMAEGWNVLTLFCGSNSSITLNSLTEYYLTFKNEISGDTFFARILGNTASYKVGKLNQTNLYGIDVTLDKAVPHLKERIPNSELLIGYNQGDPVNAYDGLEVPFARLSTYLAKGPVVSTTLRRISSWCGRRWVSTYQLPIGAFETMPLTLPSYVYNWWIPVERIYKTAFKPMTWNVKSADESSEGTFFKNFWEEPLFCNPAELRNFDFVDIGTPDDNESTLATLQHKDAFADFWLGENAFEDYNETTKVYTEDGDEILRNFIYNNGTLRAKNPEWANRVGNIGDGDLSELSPIKKGYPSYASGLTSLQFSGDNYNAYSYNGLGSVTYPNILYGTPQWLSSNFKVKGYLSDPDSDIYDFETNESDNFKGSTTPMIYPGSIPGKETTYNGAIPKLFTSTNVPGTFYRSNSLFCNSFWFKGNELADLNLLAKLFIVNRQVNADQDGLDFIDVRIKITSYDIDPRVDSSAPVVYKSEWQSIGQKQVSTAWLRDRATNSATKPIIITLGQMSFDYPESTNGDGVIACVFPDWLKSNYENSAYVLFELTTTIESSDDIRPGVHVSFLNMVSFEKASTNASAIAKTYEDVGYNQNSHFDAVLDIFTSFDKKPSYLNYTRGQYFLSIVGKGGGYPLVGQQFTSTKDTFALCKEMASRGFFVIRVNSSGQRELNTWLFNKTPLKQFSTIPTGDELGIISGSLDGFSNTPFSVLYTHAKINYGINQAGTYSEFLNIERTEESDFPDIEDYTFKYSARGGLALVYIAASDLCKIEYYTDQIPSNWGAGTILETFIYSDSGPSDPYICKIIGIVNNGSNSSTLYIKRTSGDNSILNTTIDQTASIAETSGILSWTTFVSCSEDILYSTAKSIWESFRAAYLRRGGVNYLSSSLSNAPEILADDNRNAQNIKRYVNNLAKWVTFTKETSKFRASIEDGYSSQISDCISLKDPILTDGISIIGWIYKKVLNANESYVEFEVIHDLSSYDPIDVDGIIDEGFVGINDPTDIISEGVVGVNDPANIIDEN